MKLVILILLIGIFTNVYSSEFYEGENLIVPYELSSEKWEILTKKEGKFRSMLWRSKESGMRDAYAVNIRYGSNKKPSKMRKEQDKPGKKACKSFESIELDPIDNQNYKSLLWRTVCLKEDNSKAQILNLAIKGKDSTYHLLKIWQKNVSATELNKWVDKFRTVYVCDTRIEDKHCPSGYLKEKEF